MFGVDGSYSLRTGRHSWRLHDIKKIMRISPKTEPIRDPENNCRLKGGIQNNAVTEIVASPIPQVTADPRS